MVHGPTISARSQYALVLVLTSLNETFEKKTLLVPFAPDVLKLGRQTSAKTLPAPDNGYFDCRVLSRQHAELWADKSTGKIYIRDSLSSNGTYINNERLGGSPDGSAREKQQPQELKRNDVLDLGIDICGEDGTTLVHKKISAKVEQISIISLTANPWASASTPSSPSSSSSASSSGLTSSASPVSTVTPRYKHRRTRSTDETHNGSVGGHVGGGAGRTAAGGSIGSVGGGPGIGMGNGVGLFGTGLSRFEEFGSPTPGPAAGSMEKGQVFDATVRRLLSETQALRGDFARLKSVTKLLHQIVALQQKKGTLGAVNGSSDAETNAGDPSAGKGLATDAKAGDKDTSASSASAPGTNNLNANAESGPGVDVNVSSSSRSGSPSSPHTDNHGMSHVELKAKLRIKEKEVQSLVQERDLLQKELLESRKLLAEMGSHMERTAERTENGKVTKQEKHVTEDQQAMTKQQTNNNDRLHGKEYKNKNQDKTRDYTATTVHPPSLKSTHTQSDMSAIPLISAIGVVALGFGGMLLINRINK